MTDQPVLTSMTYAGAGVDIEKAATLIEDIKGLAKQTATPGIVSGVGGFGCAFELPSGYRHPVLVSGTDGVGTKCLLANRLGRYNTLGIDLVAMCVNDILCVGAKPLYFLDYYATGCLDVNLSKELIGGIAKGCCLANTALIGGETAELPGMYQGNDYDLAGFCVGVVEKEAMLKADEVCEGDTVIALASSGPHSNGYSLIRQVVAGVDLESVVLEGRPLSDILMEPTNIYVKAILMLLGSIKVHALAHITGGGLEENLPRVLPSHLAVSIDGGSWQWPPVFRWLQQRGAIAETEMRRTFNLGIGMVAIVPRNQADLALKSLAASGETAWVLGSVVEKENGNSAVEWR